MYVAPYGLANGIRTVSVCVHHHRKVNRYLDIDDRVSILNNRLDIVNDLLESLSDQLEIRLVNLSRHKVCRAVK